MTKTAAAFPAYRNLKEAVLRVLVDGQREIESLKVTVYWKTGRLISEYLSHLPPEQRTASRLLDKLAGDLQMERSIFYRLLQFAESYPQGVAARRQLTWTHYKALLGVPDAAARVRLTQRADEEAWSVRELRLRIQKERGPEIPARNLGTEGRLEEPARLVPGIRRIKLLEEIGRPPRVTVDLGFDLYEELPVDGATKFEAGETVRREASSGKWEKGGGTSELYYYEGIVERVVDGDTLLVHISTGRNRWRRQYLRLRGLNAGELDTVPGRKAYRWLAARIRENPAVLIRTHLTDRYDRYIADVWAGNTYLNNALLDRGLAQRIF